MEKIQLEAPVVAALTSRRKIEAIKLLREQRSIGLKEAKELVELYARQHNIATSTNSGSPSAWVFLILLAISAYFSYQYFT